MDPHLTLIDSWMPAYDVAARYDTPVNAPAQQTYQAVNADFGSHPLVALLMGLRMIPGFLSEPARTWHRLRQGGASSGGTLGGRLSQRFVLLESLPPVEMVIGLTGRFWTATGGLLPTDPATFREAPPAGTARAAWNFMVTPLPTGGCSLATETRVRCADAATTRRFRRYWSFVGPGSGLIRWVMLRQIRRRAESGR